MVLLILLLLQCSLTQAALFDGCKTPPPSIDAAASADCPAGEVCDPAFLKVDGCIMSCSNGQVKFIDASGGWSAPQDKVTFNAATGFFFKSAGGASKLMSKPTCVIDPSTTQPPKKEEPKLVCGCNIAIQNGSDTYDASKLFVADWSGSAGDCMLQCEAGYVMVNGVGASKQPLSSLMCTGGRWSHAYANEANRMGGGGALTTVSCEKAPATCDTSYGKGGCIAGGECDLSKIRPIKGSKSTCLLACDRGYKLINKGTTLMQEVYSAGSSWKGRSTANHGSLMTFGPAAGVSINCVKYKNAAEKAAEVAAKAAADAAAKAAAEEAAKKAAEEAAKKAAEEAAQKAIDAACGCPYTKAGSDPKQIVVRNKYPDGKNCELACKPGYNLISSFSHPTKPYQYDMSLAVCQAGTWVGRTINVDATISLSASPSLGCNKYTQAYGAGCLDPSNWLPLNCTGCAPDQLVPVPNTKWPCILNCNAGYRLVASRPGGALQRPRLVYYTGSPNGWLGVAGQGLLVTTYYGSQAQISCEPDTLPVPVDAPIGNPPKAKPCESCRQPGKLSTCPPGKQCVTDFLPLWRTAEGCMQIRCQRKEKMQLFNNNAWSVASELNCQADGTWKSDTGVVLPASTSITCDALTGGGATLIEILYILAKKGFPMELFG